MILLTGGGKFFEAFQRVQTCKYLSLRRTHETTLRTAIAKAEAIVHNAANIQPGTVEEGVRDNFLSTYRLVNLCLAHNPGIRFVYLGSMSYLGDGSEYLPLEAMTPYAYSKFLGETLCLKCALPNVHVVRFSTIFYRDPQRDGLSKLVADAVRHESIEIYNGGEARRDFIPVEVAARYVAKIIRQQPAGKVFDIAAAREVSFGEMAAFLKQKLPALHIEDRPLTGGKKVRSQFSADSIRALGEIPFSIESEVENYLQQLQENQ